MQKITVKILTLSLLLFSFSFSQAAVKKSPILMGEGSLKGGQSGTGFSLLNVQSQVAQSKKLERIKIFVGNSALQKKQGSVGYFNVQNDPKNKRVIVDFSQTLNSQFEQGTLQKILSQSPFVKSSEIYFEPQSQTMSLILNMQKPVAVRARSFNGNSKTTAQLVLDIFEPALMKRAPANKAPKKKNLKSKKI